LVVLLAAKTAPFDAGHDRVVAAAVADVLVVEMAVAAVDVDVEVEELVPLRTNPQTALLVTAALMALFM